MRRSLLLLALAGPGWLTIPLLAADEAADRETRDLVLLAPTHPVFIRMHVQVDGGSLKAVRRAYAAELLRQHDANRDEHIDIDEARRMPPLVGGANRSETASLSESWASVDTSPADDRISVEELLLWVNRALGNPFSIAAQPQRATQSVDLFTRLDLDRDGKLSSHEVARIEQALHKLDLDDDETFTLDELSPSPVVQGAPVVGQPGGGTVADQPFALLDGNNVSDVALQLLHRYATSKDNGVPCDLLRIDSGTCATCDQNADGRLSQGELERLLSQPPAHLELLVELKQQQPGKSRLTLATDRLTTGSPAAKAGTDRLVLAAGGYSVEWRVQTNRAARADNRKFYQVEFLKADKDKNKYLNAEEFAGVGLAGTTFEQVDRDGDGMLLEPELLAYIDQEANAAQSRVVLTISHNGKSLFEALDALVVDRRLTRRELRRAAELLRTFDQDGDGAVSADELAGQYRALVELGKPLMFRTDEMQRGNATATTPVVSRPTAGPDWFVKMDRNRDGDVSRREFLGPKALFERLDRDADGLISAAEAEQAAAP
ncbi:MAG: EF-hand domain-containing protein [Planctomycetaceae bacterium]